MFTGLIGDLGVVGAVERDGDGARLRVRTRLADELKPGDSTAVDGVSLTVGGVREDGFQVRLIPETLNRTNLGSAGVGDLVNIEVDVLAKHVARLVAAADASSEVAR